MIDDSSSKMREYPDNVFVIKEFSQDILETRQVDETLTQTTEFVERILQEWKRREDIDDVRYLVREFRKLYDCGFL